MDRPGGRQRNATGFAAAGGPKTRDQTGDHSRPDPFTRILVEGCLGITRRRRRGGRELGTKRLVVLADFFYFHLLALATISNNFVGGAFLLPFTKSSDGNR